ncbi:MAG TPA: hypothetical protein DIT64_17275 [Verrucomicrobiales bacterium]|nr:hypothetical protein [Verrucomicrobiales bacterium]
MFEKLFSKGGLTLERLRGFMSMAEAGSIARAAPDDANRQSQISRQIRELEEFFDVELTRRKGRTLSLSPAGARLASLIREQLQDLEDFRRDQRGLPKSFTIGAGASVLEWLVVPALPRLAELLGGATLLIQPMRSRSLAEAVSEGRADFAILRRDAIPAAKSVLPLVKLGFVICIPERLIPQGVSDRQASHPSFWRDLPFAAGRDGGQLDLAIRAAMADAGVDYRPRFECGSILQARQLVDMGECAAVLPALGLRGMDRKRIRVLPFAPMKGYGRGLVLHWNERQTRRRAVDASTIQAMARSLVLTVREPGP